MTHETLRLHIANYDELLSGSTPSEESIRSLYHALLTQGIVGIRGVPNYTSLVSAFISAARSFSELSTEAKLKYAPVRDALDHMGYELGAEKYDGFDVDDKKASYYATIPDCALNKWPREVDLQKPYVDLANLMFETAKKILSLLGLNNSMGLNLENFYGWGRMLHYHKVGDESYGNPLWAGAHFDHSVFTGLIPSFYFQNGEEIVEPSEAGLFVLPTEKNEYAKIPNDDKSILLFQVGEFGQLASNDRIKATKHKVQKALGAVERYTLAIFLNAANDTRIWPKSNLTVDPRYLKSQASDGSVTFGAWHEATLAQFRH